MAVTDNYGLYLPTDQDEMSAVEQNITNSLDILEPRADPTVIAAGGALPQTGNYNVGDRVFRNDIRDLSVARTYPSTYILVCKDANWGWHWRPVQQNLSPWVTVPAGCISDTTNYEIHPTYPLAIAMNSQGFCHWRGALRKKTVNIPEATNINVLKVVPEGIRPHLRLVHTIPVSPVVSGTGEGGYVGGRFYMNELGENNFRFINTNNATSQTFWLTGLKYQPSKGFFYNA